MPDFDLDKKYWINAGKKGTFKGLADEVWGISSRPGDVDKIFAHLHENNLERLAIYIHGGLVPEYFGGRSAIEFHALLSNTPGVHPVTFIWESGPHEIAVDGFKKSLKSIIAKKLFVKAVEILKGRVEPKGAFLFDKGLENITVHEMEGVDNEILSQISDDVDADIEIISLLEEEGIETGFLTEDEYDELNKLLGVFSAIKAAAVFKYKLGVAATKCLWRFVTKRSHGLLETISEELFRVIGVWGESVDDIGQFLWSGMRDKTKYMFSSNEGRIGLNQYTGTYFLEKISEYQQSHNLDVDVFSTSAGAIAICNMIKLNKQNGYGARFRNIVFMAPAANFDDFKESIIECSDSYNSFRIFTMSDEKEKDDNFLIIYRNSLLYLISGILERKEKGNVLFGKDYPDSPLIGMDRHTSSIPKYTRTSVENEVAEVINDSAFKRLVLSPATGQGAGLNCTALKHGGFLGDLNMSESIKSIIRDGSPME